MSPGDIQVEQQGKTVRIRVPIHVEEVFVQKRTVVYEEVDVRRELIEEIRPAPQPS